MSSPQLKTVSAITFEQITEGLEQQACYRMTAPVYEAMTQTFGDRNPLHMDDEYARSQGFRNKVMHGAILQGFLSHFIGMVFPGEEALLLSTQLSYLAPSYLGDDLKLSAVVSQKVQSQRVLVLRVTFQNQTQNQTVGRGLVHVRIR